MTQKTNHSVVKMGALTACQQTNPIHPSNELQEKKPPRLKNAQVREYGNDLAAGGGPVATRGAVSFAKDLIDFIRFAYAVWRDQRDGRQF